MLNSPSYGMTEEQKAYWKGIDSQVKTPFEYGYYEGWAVIISCFELFLFPLLAVCMIIAPVFSSEYQTGTDAVILAGKFGRTKLVRAKIIVSLLFGVLAFTIHVMTAYAVPLAAFGTDGWDLPVQISNIEIPYPFTFLEAVLVNTGVIYLVLLGMISLTLLLSAKMKSPYLVLTVIVPILFVPMFLSPNSTTGAYNLTVFLLPYQAAIPRYSKYISYQIGGLAVDAFTMRAITYGILTAVLLPFVKMREQ